MMLRLYTIAFTLLLLFIATMAHGAAIDIRMVQQSVVSRTMSNIPVTITLTQAGTGVVEGTLELVVRDGPAELCTLTLPDIVIAGGRYQTQVLLPPIPVQPWNAGDFLYVYPTFITAAERLTLDSLQLVVGGANPAVRVVGVCHVGERGALPVEGNIAGLRFEQVLGSLVSNDMETNLAPDVRLDLARGMFSTAQANLPPEIMPTVAEAYCAYDVVVIAGRAMGVLTEEQLAAVEAWVRAGGSLLIVPGPGMSDTHRQFIQRLAIEKGPVPLESYVLGEAAQAIMVEPDLGRVVIWPGGTGPTNLMASREWREMVAFLWRLYGPTRDHFLASVAEQDEKAKAEKPTVNVSDNWQNRSFFNSFMAAPAVDHQVFEQWFMPVDLKLVPTMMIVLLFIGVFVIGVPADFLLLGWLRRRRWTWVMFPATCVLAAVLMMSMTYSYLGRHQSTRSLTIVDLDDAGRPLRSTRLAVDFVSAAGPVETVIDDAMLVPMSVEDLQRNANYYYGYSSGQEGQPAMRYAGRPTRRATLGRYLNQWEPAATRSFDIEPTDIPLLTEQWPEVVKAMKTNDWLSMQNPDMTAVAWPKGTDQVFIASGYGAYYSGHASIYESASFSPVERMAPPGAGRVVQTVSWNRPAADMNLRTVQQVMGTVDGLTIYPQGILSNLAMIAPHGGPRLDDLPLTGPQGTDGRFVLIIIRYVGDDQIIAYRYLYRGQR